MNQSILESINNDLGASIKDGSLTGVILVTYKGRDVPQFTHYGDISIEQASRIPPMFAPFKDTFDPSLIMKKKE